MSLEHFSKEILGKDIPLYSLKIALFILSNKTNEYNIDDLCKQMLITKRKLIGEFDKFRSIDGFYSIEQDADNYVLYILGQKYILLSPKKKKNKSEKRKEKNVSQREQEIFSLFELWCEVMGKTSRTILDAARRRVLNTALDTLDYETCRKAIIGCSKSTWHMGVSERSHGKQYNTLELIFRNADKIETFISLYDAPTLEEQLKIESLNKKVQIQDRMEDDDWLKQRLSIYDGVDNTDNSSQNLEHKKTLSIENKNIESNVNNIPLNWYNVEGLAEESMAYFKFEKNIDIDDENIENAVFEEIIEDDVPLYMQFAQNKDE